MNEEAKQVFAETAQFYEEKYEPIIKELMDENKHLKQQLKKTHKKMKELKRIVNKRASKNKQHFKNGKRGSMKNGG